MRRFLKRFPSGIARGKVGDDAYIEHEERAPRNRAYRVIFDTNFLADRRQVVHGFFAKFAGRQAFLCCIELRDAITL